MCCGSSRECASTNQGATSTESRGAEWITAVIVENISEIAVLCMLQIWQGLVNENQALHRGEYVPEARAANFSAITRLRNRQRLLPTLHGGCRRAVPAFASADCGPGESGEVLSRGPQRMW